MKNNQAQKNKTNAVTRTAKGTAPKNVKVREVEKKRKPLPSPTGAGYDMHFDAVSSMPKIDDRSETFDELIGTVIGANSFTISRFSINPGNAITFPWLSRIAGLFERYQFEMLEFYFQHDVSQFNSQGSAGLVIMSVLFDAAASSPISKVQVEATHPHVICMPNQNSLCRVPVSRLHPRGVPFFVRSGTVPGGTDIKTYDCGNLFVTVQGMVGTGEVGELHVRGRVKLIDRILDNIPPSFPSNNTFVFLESTAGESLTSTLSYIMLMAGPQIGSLGLSNVSGDIVLPPGNYLVNVDVQCDFSGLATKFQLFPLINSSPIVSDAVGCYFSSGTQTYVSLHRSTFISSDGSTIFNVGVSATFSTGVATVTGTVMISVI